MTSLDMPDTLSGPLIVARRKGVGGGPSLGQGPELAASDPTG